MTNVTKLDRHLTSAFGIADVKAYLGLQRSDDLNPVYVGIWLAFAKCRPESPGLSVCYSFLTLSWKGAPIIKKPVHWFQSIMKKLKALALFSFLFFFFFKLIFSERPSPNPALSPNVINPFPGYVPFLYHLKTSENL